MRLGIVVLWMLLFSADPGHGPGERPNRFPSINIGINVPVYPELVLVPGYPVYYDPRADWNYFFYDGLYWVYQETTGTRAAGTTGPGVWWGRRLCRCSCCASRCATTGSLRRIFAAGPPTRRPLGRALGPRLGGASRRMGPVGPRPSRARTAARLPAAVLGGSLSPGGAAAVLRSQYRYQPQEAVVREHYKQQGSPSSSRPLPSQGAAPHQQQMPRSQGHREEPEGRKTQAREERR